MELYLGWVVKKYAGRLYILLILLFIGTGCFSSPFNSAPRTSGGSSSTTSAPTGGGATTTSAPSITRVFPSGGPLAGGHVITLTGTDFTASTTVAIGSTSCSPVTFTSSTQISCTTSAKAAGTYDVVATDSAGTGTLTNGYKYRNPTFLGNHASESTSFASGQYHVSSTVAGGASGLLG